jgi:hypothetical protein
MESNATICLSLVGALKVPHLFDIVEVMEKKKPFREFRKQLQLCIIV